MTTRVIFGAWPYLYTVPGLHNAVSIVRADIFARWSRLIGDKVYFITGYDEFGSRIEMTALQKGTTPQNLVDELFPIAQECLRLMNISADVVARSTSVAHVSTAQKILRDVKANGWIFEDNASFAYCPRCTRYLPDRFVEGRCPKCGAKALGDQCKQCGTLLTAFELLEPQCAICGSETEIRSTSEWYLDLPRMVGRLNDLIADSKWPRAVVDTSSQYLSEVGPFVISRHSEWGVPFPEDNSGRIIYNWVDSVLGDVSSVESNDSTGQSHWWKSEECSTFFFLGKDNIPYFTILLPSLLLAANESHRTPEFIVPNDFMLFDGEVCSKMTGKGIRLNEAVAMLDSDYWRFLIAEMFPEPNDSVDFDFTWDTLATLINKYLVSIVDRFVLDVFQAIEKWGISSSDHVSSEDQLYVDEGLKKLAAIKHGVETFDFRYAAQNLVELCRSERRLDATFTRLATGRLAAFCIVGQCILPNTIDTIWQMFGFDAPLSSLTLADAEQLVSSGYHSRLNLQSYRRLFTRVTAKRLEIEYSDVISRPEIETLRGIGELCPCERWSPKSTSIDLTTDNLSSDTCALDDAPETRSS